jgi:hypothetical protein
VFVTNHALSGALVGRLLKRRPAVAFVVGLGSHLILDALPHWGCDMTQPGGNERLLAAAKRDGVLGLVTMGVATLAAERSARVATLAAMTGAVLLDVDKPLVYFFGLNPFPASVRRLHSRIQRESPEGIHKEIKFGFAFAAADALAAVAAHRRGAAAAPH